MSNTSEKTELRRSAVVSNLNKLFDEVVRDEKQLIVTTTYKITLCGDKFVEIGLCPENNFSPIIHITKHGAKIPSIYLDEAEYSTLLDHKHIIDNFFADSSNYQPQNYTVSSSIHFEFHKLYNKKCVKIVQPTSKGAVYFTQPTWQYFRKLKTCILTTIISLLDCSDAARTAYTQILEEIRSFFPDPNQVTYEMVEAKLDDPRFGKFFSNNTSYFFQKCASEMMLTCIEKMVNDLKCNDVSKIEPPTYADSLVTNYYNSANPSFL